MSVNKALLQRVMNLSKEAYVPPTPPPMDPAMMGGAPPMDPAMMGGMPPMDPAMMGGAPPMDPAMMGGAPPMDPAMMGMDPAMMGGAPPMDPAMMGGAPPEDPAGGMPIMVNMQDLQAILAEASGGAGGAGAPEAEGDKKRVTNRDLGERMDNLEMLVAAVAEALQVPLPEGGLMAPTETSEVPPEEAPPEIPITEPAEMAAGPVGMPDPMGGVAPISPADGAMMPPANMKTASAGDGQRDLMARLRKLNSYM